MSYKLKVVLDNSNDVDDSVKENFFKRDRSNSKCFNELDFKEIEPISIKFPSSTFSTYKTFSPDIKKTFIYPVSAKSSKSTVNESEVSRVEQLITECLQKGFEFEETFNELNKIKILSLDSTLHVSDQLEQESIIKLKK